MYSSRKWSAVVFFVVAGILLAMHGNRFVLTNDEGILLEPARRMIGGARPYVDFFGYMSPGSYWIQSLFFRFFGLTYWAGRLPVILDFSLECALLYWLLAKLASQRAATATVLVFAGYHLADPSLLTAQHRWDSSALALAGICAALEANAWRMALSGALLAASAWCTPSVALVTPVVGLWLAFSKTHRRLLLPFLAGAAAVTALAVAKLSSQGALWAFIEQMFWLRKNYSRVNAMPYGSVIGGYGHLIEGVHGFELVMHLVLITYLALPAIVPLSALALSGAAFLRKKVPVACSAAFVLLTACVPALVIGAFPRADLMHLTFVSVIPYALTGAALSWMLSLRASAIITFTLLPLSTLFFLSGVLDSTSARTAITAAGGVRAQPATARELTKLMAAVHRGDSLFVYPYAPVFYFLTETQNASRFDYLAAGMMTSVEEEQVLSELKQNPPRWVMYMSLPQEEFLRAFPNGHGLSPRFEMLEQWLNQNYLAVPNDDRVNIGGYQLMRLKQTGLPLSANR